MNILHRNLDSSEKWTLTCPILEWWSVWIQDAVFISSLKMTVKVSEYWTIGSVFTPWLEYRKFNTRTNFCRLNTGTSLVFQIVTLKLVSVWKVEFAKVMKGWKPSTWVKVDKFQGLLHLQILRTLNFHLLHWKKRLALFRVKVSQSPL